MKLDLLVPTSLHDIPLKHYQKFIKTFENADDYTEDYAALKMLEIFCGVPYSEAIKFKVGDINRVVSKLNEALAEKPSLINRFKLGSTEFGFVPELNDLTFGEFVDIENNITDWDNMHKAMAVLYRPIVKKYKKKYEIEDYRGDNWYDAMLDMPASVAVSAIVFFYNLETDLLNLTLDSGQVPSLQTEASTQTQTLTKSGGGIHRYTN
tara:strand:- start:283 stop:906 length:624 start_codon:yes stop_codon:yes gene_type:complete